MIHFRLPLLCPFPLSSGSPRRAPVPESHPLHDGRTKVSANTLKFFPSPFSPVLWHLFSPTPVPTFSKNCLPSTSPPPVSRSSRTRTLWVAWFHPQIPLCLANLNFQDGTLYFVYDRFRLLPPPSVQCIISYRYMRRCLPEYFPKGRSQFFRAKRSRCQKENIFWSQRTLPNIPPLSPIVPVLELPS